MIRLSLRRGAAPMLLAAGAVLFVAAGFLAPSTPSAQALSNCDVGNYSLDSTEMEFLDLINEYRTSNGLNELTISTNLNRAAHWMGNDLGTNAYFSHTDSLGRSPYSRAIDCGYPAGAGENLAAGTAWSTAQSAFTAWQNSPGHNANMLNSFYRQIGIARVNVPGSPYGWYWVTNFGATNDGTGGGSSPTSTPTSQPTSTPTQQPTNTPVPQATNTPTPVQSQPTATPNSAPSNPPASTPTATPTQAGSLPFSPPATSTPTPTATATRTAATTPAQQAATPTPTATPRPSTATSPSGSLALRPGTNLIGWTGPSASPREALSNVQSNVQVVYGYDNETGTWQRYAPGLPTFVNNLTLMETGEAYWVFMK